MTMKRSLVMRQGNPNPSSLRLLHLNLSQRPRHVTRPSRNRKAPVRLDPGTYVSTQHEASHVYKADTTMWSESAGYVEPQSYEKAVNNPLYGKEWRAVVQEEYDSLMKNGAWELTDLPPGKNLVTCKWVFKAKHDANGNITRFKARLVARGYSQAYGIDYFDNFAPLAKLTTYRTIFALAALEKWEIHGMDVITAYLLGKLDEEIYMM
jgi:Reverse transcriptase (RNA-dependent DNA polymerase)